MQSWTAFAMIAVMYFGNFYVYDSIGPVADLLQQSRGFSDSQIGMLNAIYSLPNVVCVLVGGYLVDRFGAAWILLWSTALCLAGSVLTAFGANFPSMAAGRLFFGIGAETQNLALMVGIVDWFSSAHLAFAMGLSLGIGRLGSFAADMSPTWFANAYAAGWQPPLVIAVAIAAAGMVAVLIYLAMSLKFLRGTDSPREKHPKLSLADILSLGRAYWYLLLLCALWYAVILAFRSTFSIKYFQHVRGLDLASAGAMNSYVFFAAIFATPAFGWLCDRSGRYAPWLAVGAGLLPIAIGIIAYTPWNLWIATALIGVSYSVVPAVMWPMLARIVPPERLGTAMGLMWVIQNAGIAGANLAAGWLNDAAGAGPLHPAGYEPMMEFFGISSAAGFLFALALWRSAGQAHHEGKTSLAT